MDGCCTFDYEDNYPPHDILTFSEVHTYCQCVNQAWEHFAYTASWDCGAIAVATCGLGYRSSSTGEESNGQIIDISQEVRESGRTLGSRGSNKTDCDMKCLLAGCDCNCIDSENGIVCI
tara:strand:- start:794 stop:1150 length:357 start_codon:yes stop_codon:yes gene_type:complete